MTMERHEIMQPPPTKNAMRPVWEIVIEEVPHYFAAFGTRPDGPEARVLEDMKERDRVGREKYGTPLQPHNGRNALVDAYQEALDLVVYLRQHCIEGGLTRLLHSYDAWGPELHLYRRALDMALALKTLIMGRNDE